VPPDEKKPFENVEEIFSQFGDLFGELFGNKRGVRGSDLAVPLKLSYVEARDGTKRTIEVARRTRCVACHDTPSDPCLACKGTGQVQHQQGFFMVQTTCAGCKGSGQLASCGACDGGLVRTTATLDVTVPPGVKPGVKLRLPERGDEHPTGRPGHLFLEIVIDNTNVLVRDGDDVTFETEVPMHRSLLGGELEVETLDGREMVHVPKFVRDGAVVTIAGKGHARVAAGSGDPYRGDIVRGDQRVILRLSRETQLRRRQVVASTVAFCVAAAIALLALI
jgi:molecular chaperone DnaJ